MDYKNFFGFSAAPFHLTPDPAFYFPSDGHREALQTLLYSVRAGEGFVQITGDPGTGKTLLIRTILKELGEGFSTALIFNPRLSPQELIRTLLEDLGLDQAMIENLPREDLLRRFRDFLLDKAEHGEKVLIIIDEAQNLPLDTLEELRLLSNLETEKEKLLQIILVGQRELEQRLDRPEVQQLYQRITIRYQLRYLQPEDIRAYIYHRIQVVTPEDTAPTVQFTHKALQSIYQKSNGTPRLINIICERSLMAAYVEGTKTIQPEHVKKAMASIRGNDEEPDSQGGARRVALSAVAGLVLVCLVVFGVWRYSPEVYELPGLRVLRPVVAAVDVRLAQELGLWQAREPAAAQSASTDPPVDPEPIPVKPAKAQNGSRKAAGNTSAAADMRVTVSREASEKTAPAEADQEPRPPQEAVLLAPGAYVAHVRPEADDVRVWKGTAEGPELVERFASAWPHGRGLYVAGRDPDRGGYVFNHAAFLRGNPSMQASTFFERLQPVVRDNAVAVIATSQAAPAPEALDRAEEVRAVFERFIANWEDQRLDALFELYGSLIISHYADQPKPIVLSKEQSYERKQEVFRRNQRIDLGVSRPLVLVNPADPSNVAVVYHQRYRSETWDDDGTKVLYFNHQGQDQDPAWKVAAEMWVPDLGGEGEEGEG